MVAVVGRSGRTPQARARPVRIAYRTRAPARFDSDPRPTEPDAVSGPPVEVLVNGETRCVPGGCTVDELLERLGLERRRIAVAINREGVPRSSFGAHPIAAGDRVEILEAVGGGA